jgi:hypothetical protein
MDNDHLKQLFEQKTAATRKVLALTDLVGMNINAAKAHIPLTCFVNIHYQKDTIDTMNQISVVLNNNGDILAAISGAIVNRFVPPNSEGTE